MKKDFNLFLTQLSQTNATLDYFVDFEKITNNIEKIKIKLNQLNYLLGQEDLKTATQKLFEENNKVFEVLQM